jgi:UDP-galactopyranose mutase
MKCDFLIVGAGFAGCVLAERIASRLGATVLLVERRNHIGGAAYDYYNEHGILVQAYGPHIFHTTSRAVWEYLSRFTRWNGYIHRVLACVNGIEVYLPININTIERLYGCRLTPKKLRAFLAAQSVKPAKIRNARDVVVSQVGTQLYELFFKNYTRKQWGIWPEHLDPQVTARLPVRFSRDSRYFSDPYQGIPRGGYTPMFAGMLDHKNIHILLNTDYKDIRRSVKCHKLIYTGPVDYYFNYAYGALPYRSLQFKHRTLNVERYQNAAVVNYPNRYRFTRITEFKYLYLQQHPKTTICYEYPQAQGPPYYPLPTAEAHQLYLKYKKLADRLSNVYFIGRLAQYRYLNMDQVVGSALKLFQKIKNA